MMRAIPRVIFSLPLAEADAGPDEGLAVAVSPSGELVVQFCVGEHRLARYSADTPPQFNLPQPAACALALAVLREFAPEAFEAVDALHRQRLQLVSAGGGPEAA